MKENILGANIKHLREIQKETQQQLADYLNVDKSTVQGYEAGRRKPELGILKQIAKHYGKTVDVLLLSDLSDTEPIQIDINSAATVMDVINTMFPLYSSDEAMNNNSFKKGYELSQRLLDGFSKNRILPGNIIISILEAFMTSAEETDTPESIANILWCFFIWWNQLYDMDKLISLHTKQMSKKATFKDMMLLREKESDEIKAKRAGFVNDFDGIIVSALSALKSDPEWANVADYYLALRYLCGMVNNELSPEMNRIIGEQMMVSFMSMDNELAIRIVVKFLL